ncbi:MAG: diguanylate cyclase [Planctomycetes bacterium]|nr:diguanylate cyclase [Planctomycetota bacterium]
MNILLAEDDPTTRTLLEKSLVGWGHTVFCARNGAEAWEIFRTKPIQIVLTDWMMPKVDGLELCRRIRNSKLYSMDPVYVILLTARDSVESLSAGIAAGADNYIAKPCDQEELRARVNAGVRILELQQELVAARRELERLALTDPLTGLLNRRALMDTLTREEDRMRRENRPLGLILADVDHFKLVNDSHGHLAGDKVLEVASQCLQGTIRTGDSVGRWGGEEFLLVLPGADIIQTAEIAERCRALLESQRTTTEHGHVLQITASFGAASTEAPHRIAHHELVQCADQAMYWAKEAGRNRVKIHVGPQGRAA